MHEYIDLTEIELDILKTYSLQRLRRIIQLSGVHFVYPGAMSSRFDHSLGVMHVAGQMAQHLGLKYGWDDETIQDIRLGGLLHDVGHGPFSHCFDIFLKKKNKPINHEDIGYLILQIDQELREVLEKYVEKCSQTNDVNEKIKRIAHIAWNPDKQRDIYSDIIHGPPHCADILDYLLRDSRSTGVKYGEIDLRRLIICSDEFNGKLGMGKRAYEAYEAMIYGRLNMFRTVYWHRTATAADHLLIEVLDAVDKYLTAKYNRKAAEKISSFFLYAIDSIEESPSIYLAIDDTVVIDNINEIFWTAEEELRSFLNKNEIDEIKSVARRFMYRRLPKRVFHKTEFAVRNDLEKLGIKQEEAEKIWTDKMIRCSEEKGHKISGEDFFYEYPSLKTYPVDAKIGSVDNIGFFLEENGKKVAWRPPLGSILYELDPMSYEFRVYYKGENEELRKLLEEFCPEIWPEKPVTEEKIEEERKGQF